MKRIITGMILVVAMLMLAACGKSGKDKGSNSTDAPFDPAQLKTMGDAYVYDDPDIARESYTETGYAYVFQVDGIYYRVTTSLTAEVSDALWAIDFFDEDREQKIRELISPLEISSVVNLSEQILSQEELDKFVGKAGKDLFDDGWTYVYYNLADMEAVLGNGSFEYLFKFEYNGEPMDNTDDFDFYEEFKDLPVSSVSFYGLGDAANPD